MFGWWRHTFSPWPARGRQPISRYRRLGHCTQQQPTWSEPTVNIRPLLIWHTGHSEKKMPTNDTKRQSAKLNVHLEMSALSRILLQVHGRVHTFPTGGSYTAHIHFIQHIKLYHYFADMFRCTSTTFVGYLANSVFITESPFRSQMHSLICWVYTWNCSTTNVKTLQV